MAVTSSQAVRPRRVHTSTILRHVVINFFMLLIILPLAWVLLLSIKSIPDAYTGDLWPKQFDFSHYGYVLSKIQTLPRNMLNSVMVLSSEF
jgi:ABC-type glycerol-3-phosphate transport system permease component